MSQERRGDIESVVLGCKNRWDKYSIADREETLESFDLPKSQAFYKWSALETDTRNAIIAEEMEYLVGKHQEGYQMEEEVA